jgi:hypothetical protein
MANKPSEMVTLKIPRPLYDRLKQLIEGTGFRSVTEFAIYILRDLASRPEGEKSAPKTGRLTPGELQAIRDRLRELGYL